MRTLTTPLFVAPPVNRVRVLLTFVVLWLGLATAAEAAAHTPKPAGPVVLHPSFHRIVQAGYLLSNDRYVFAGVPYGQPVPASSGLLLDEGVAKRTTVFRPTGATSCGGEAVGGPLMVAFCFFGQSMVPESYSISGRTWQPFIYTPAVCQLTTQGSCDVVAIGTHWIEIKESCYHCANTYVFQNIQTGEVRSDPTHPTTTADVNSPRLAHRVCSPLAVPRADDGGGDSNLSGWGSLRFYGSFAVAFGTDEFGNPSVYLERCGSRLHLPIESGLCYLLTCVAPVANSHAVIWQSPGTPRTLIGQSAETQLNGYFLPSMRRFVITLPAPLTTQTLTPPQSSVVLTTRNLYVLDGTGELWRTATPTLPSSPTSARHRPARAH
jgi:hypothetical protein